MKPAVNFVKAVIASSLGGSQIRHLFLVNNVQTLFDQEITQLFGRIRAPYFRFPRKPSPLGVLFIITSRRIG